MSGTFNTQSPQDQTAAARQWLQQRGLPMNANNLNRAMAALMGLPDEGASDRTAGAIERTMQPRTPRRAGGDSARPNAPQSATPNSNNSVAETTGRDEVSETADTPPRPIATATPPAAATTPSPSTMGDGSDLAAAFPGGGGPDAGSNIGPVEAALTMLAPMAMMPIPGAQAGAGAARGLSLGLNRPMLTRPVTRMGDEAVAAMGPARLPAPNAQPPIAGAGGGAGGPPMIPGPQTPPFLPGPNGAAARLPPPAAGVNPAEAQAAAMSMSRAPAQPPRPNRNALGAQRGQQAMPDTAPVRQPNTQGTERARHQPLRQRLLRNRLHESAGRGR